MKSYLNSAAAAALVVVASTILAGEASASIVCNGAGQYWHTHRSYAYLPAYGVVVHPEGWKWGADDHYVWREHRGRGYWRDGVWVSF